jgi:hypothetical protein
MNPNSRTLLLALSTLLLCSSCANIRPPEAPSLHLPKPPADLRAIRKGDKVTLTWTVPTLTTDRGAIRNLGPTLICRTQQAELAQCQPQIAHVPAVSVRPGKKQSDTYTDNLPSTIPGNDPAAFANYAVEVLNSEGRGAGLSNVVRVPLIRTLPPPTGFKAKVTAQGIVLTGTTEPPPLIEVVHYAVHIDRRQEGSGQTVLAGEVPLASERNFTFTDTNIEWQKTYEYHADVVTVIPQEKNSPLEVAGEDTPDVTVFADDTFPPSVPTGLQAVFSGPGQQPFVDLIWAPDNDADLAGYNVYRREDSGASVKLNPELLKSPAYRDTQVSAGKTYVYSVTAVDLRGNESPHSEEASETLP